MLLDIINFHSLAALLMFASNNIFINIFAIIASIKIRKLESLETAFDLILKDLNNTLNNFNESTHNLITINNHFKF